MYEWPPMHIRARVYKKIWLYFTPEGSEKMYRKSLFTSENWISILYITLQALDVYTM